MDFEELKSPWSEYRTPDGRVLKVRHILTEIIQCGIDEEGDPSYSLNFAMVAHVGPKPVMLGGQHAAQNALTNYDGLSHQNAVNGKPPKSELQ